MAKIDGTHIGGLEHGPVRWRLPPGKTLNPTMNHIGRLILGDLKRRMQLGEITQGQSIIHTFADGVTVQAISIFGEDGMADYDEIRITGGKERDICIGFIARIVSNDFFPPDPNNQVFGVNFFMRVKEPWVSDADQVSADPEQWRELYAASGHHTFVDDPSAVVPASDGNYYLFYQGRDVSNGANPDKDTFQAFMGTFAHEGINGTGTQYYATEDFYQRQDPVVRVIGNNYTIDGQVITIQSHDHNRSSTIDMDLNTDNPGYDPTIPAVKRAVTAFAIPWRQQYKTSEFGYNMTDDSPGDSIVLSWNTNNAVPFGDYEIEIVSTGGDVNYTVDIITLGSKYAPFQETNDTIEYVDPPEFSNWAIRGANKYVVTVGREVDYIPGADNPHVKAVEN